MKSKKSIGVAIALAFFFGPLGMLYTTTKGCLIMILLNILVAIIGVLTLGIGYLLGIVTWIVGIIWSVNAAKKTNAEVDLMMAQMMSKNTASE